MLLTIQQFSDIITNVVKKVVKKGGEVHWT